MGLANVVHEQWGNRRIVFGNHTMPASYATGGDPSDPGSLLTIEQVFIQQPLDGRLYTYDATNRKVVAKHYDYPAAAAGAAIEVAAATNLSGTTLKMLFVCKHTTDVLIEGRRGPGL